MAPCQINLPGFLRFGRQASPQSYENGSDDGRNPEQTKSDVEPDNNKGELGTISPPAKRLPHLKPRILELSISA